MPVGAVTIDWVPIGDPGNADDTCRTGSVFPVPAQDVPCGAVAYEYSISKYEVTNAQYAEFLNAKAASDPLQLYHPSMGSDVHGGIVRAGSDGSYSYTVKPGFADKPVNFVSAYDAARFTNWLNNGQGSGDTESGAYTLRGSTPVPSNSNSVLRSPDAKIVLPNHSEWHKAAYYDALSATYFVSAAGSGSVLTCTAPGATPNTGNCFGPNRTQPAPGRPATVTDVGAYTGSPSPYGTFDQGGNVAEWADGVGFSSLTLGLGGSFATAAPDLRVMDPVYGSTQTDRATPLL